MRTLDRRAIAWRHPKLSTKRGGGPVSPSARVSAPAVFFCL